VSGLLGAVGSVYSANAEASAAKYSAQINERNAQFAERRARDALDRGREEEQRVREKGNQLKGQQVAQMAAAGLDLGFGSPLDILVDTTVGIELDSARTRRNAALEADDYDRQAWSYRAQASLDRATAKNARAAGRIGAAGSVLSGVTNASVYRAKISAG
jgi:hypothetical protein